jgi:hypothetical protein
MPDGEPQRCRYIMIIGTRLWKMLSVIALGGGLAEVRSGAGAELLPGSVPGAWAIELGCASPRNVASAG